MKETVNLEMLLAIKIVDCILISLLAFAINVWKLEINNTLVCIVALFLGSAALICDTYFLDDENKDKKGSVM